MKGFLYIIFINFNLIVLYNTCTAQQMWGISGSNYAGISNIDLNPSTMVISKVGWDINIVSFDAGVINNSFYSKPQFVIPTLFNNEIKFATSNTSSEKRLNEADIVIRDDIQPSSFLYMNVNVKGPSIMYNTGEHAFAFTTAFRTGISGFGLPASTVRMAYENLNYPALYNQPLHVEKGVGLGAMAWMELGGSYAHKIYDGFNYLISGGASLKFLIGNGGGFAISHGVDYMIPYRANFTATDLNLDYGHSIANEKNPSITEPTGRGVSADIGFTIIKKNRRNSGTFYGCPTMTQRSRLQLISRNYKWKLGMSLIDFGGIQFTYMSEMYSYDNVKYAWDTITHIKPTTLAELDKVVYDYYYSKGNASHRNNFFIWTPTAVSAQFDYHIKNPYYVNVSVIQRLVIATEARVARLNAIALIPRFETEAWEVAMPLILNEYMYPNLGLMVRYKNIFLGTDQLGSTLGFTSLYGLNLYMGIKISNLGPIRREPKLVY